VIAAAILLKQCLFDKKLRRKICRFFCAIILEESDLPKKGKGQWVVMIRGFTSTTQKQNAGYSSGKAQCPKSKIVRISK
jgi:hypothetical protein